MEVEMEEIWITWASHPYLWDLALSYYDSAHNFSALEVEGQKKPKTF